MNPDDLPWAREAWRELFQLAHFAKDTSQADGVVSLFVRGPHAKLGWSLAPELYAKLPALLYAAYKQSFEELEWLMSDPGVQLPEGVRKNIEEVLDLWRKTQPAKNN